MIIVFVELVINVPNEIECWSKMWAEQAAKIIQMKTRGLSAW